MYHTYKEEPVTEMYFFSQPRSVCLFVYTYINDIAYFTMVGLNPGVCMFIYVIPTDSVPVHAEVLGKLDVYVKVATDIRGCKSFTNINRQEIYDL